MNDIEPHKAHSFLLLSERDVVMWIIDSGGSISVKEFGIRDEI